MALTWLYSVFWFYVVDLLRVGPLGMNFNQINFPSARSQTNNPLSIDLFNNTSGGIIRPTSPAPLQITSARGSFHSQQNNVIRSAQGSFHQGPSTIIGFGGPSPLAARNNPLAGENRFSAAAAQKIQQNVRMESPLQQPYGSMESGTRAMYRSHQNLPSFTAERQQAKPATQYQVESPYGMQQPVWGSNQENKMTPGLKRSFYTSQPKLPEFSGSPAAESPQFNAAMTELISTLTEQYILMGTLAQNRRPDSGLGIEQEKLGTLKQKIRKLDEEIFNEEKQMTEVKVNRDKLKLRRRYLKAKQLQAIEVQQQLPGELQKLNALKASLREESNKFEIQRSKLIGDLEKPLREQAELAAMKAATQSYWANNDPELMGINQRILQLESQLKRS